MKVSEITLETVKDYCGVSGSDSDALLNGYMAAAKGFICGYTGLNAEQADEHEEFSVAFLCLVNDMHTNRTRTVDKAELNPTVEQILAMHSVNYL